MELMTILQKIGEKFKTMKSNIETEEATKNAFVMPFIQSLGYNVFDPTEVIPEYTADFGIKKGEKVDYCILMENKPVILIECKHRKESLDKHDGQLYRYFSITNAKFSILTNGVVYKFFSDLDNKNVMDKKPFLTIDLENIEEHLVEELGKFQKNVFNQENILSCANELKYNNAIKEFLSKEFSNPSDEFSKFIGFYVYQGRITSKFIENFRPILKKSIQNFINEQVNNRLKSALKTNSNNSTSEKEVKIQEETKNVNEDITESEEKIKDKEVVTTIEELEGFFFIKSILMKVVPTDKIKYRDTASYFGILFDDNNRKPICRLYFNGKNKYIQFIDEHKKGTKHLLSNIDEIFKFEEEIKEIALSYMK